MRACGGGHACGCGAACAAAGIAARSPSDAKALSVSTHSVRKGGRESFALCDEGGAVAVFEPANQ